MRLREYFETISFNSTNSLNTIGFLPSNIQNPFKYKIENLLFGFNVSYSEIPCNNIVPLPEFKNFVAWEVGCPPSELYMKFTALGWNPPGGVVNDKTHLYFDNINIQIRPGLNEYTTTLFLEVK